jgi:RNA polymerase sigma factor (sigma-70 family)
MATGPLSGALHHLRRAAVLLEGKTDGQLLESFLARRDEAAFEALVRRHGPTVLGAVRRVLRDSHDAEDAFQATFLVLVRKAAAVGRKELLGNWLYGTAYRAALEVKAARRRSRAIPLSGRPEPEAPAAGAGDDLRPLLDRELSRLPEKYRAALVLCYLEGRSRREAARQLGIPEGTLSSRLATARQKLAGRLARHGLGALAGGLAALSAGTASAAVPAPLVVATVTAAAAVAAGGVAPPGAAALTEGVLRAMTQTRRMTAVAALGAACLLACGALVLGHARPAPAPQVAQDRPPSRFLQSDHWVASVAWAPDGKALGTVTFDMTADGPLLPAPDVRATAVRLWDVRTGGVKRTLADDALKPRTKEFRWWRFLAFSPDGKTVAAASDGAGDGTHGGAVVLWDAETAKRKHTLMEATLVRCLTFSPDGKTVVYGSGGEEVVKLWDARTGKLQRSLKKRTDDSYQVFEVAFTPDGKTLATFGQTGGGAAAVCDVTLWDAETGALLRELPKADLQSSGLQPCLAFAPDGRTLAAAGQELRLWDVRTGEVKPAPDLGPGKWWLVAFSPDGRYLAAGGERDKGPAIALWDVRSGKLTATLKGHTRRIWSLAFSPDGKTLAAGGEDGRINLWDFDGRATEAK